MDEQPDAAVDNELGGELEQGVDSGLSAPEAEQDDTDWKAIAEKERERAENYKKAFTQKREFVKANANIQTEELDEDAPLTAKSFNKLLNERVVPLVAASKEDSLLSKITDPAKRSYVKQLLESRIVRTGTSDEDIQNDIEAALAIADSKKKDKTISELARAAQNKPLSPSAGSSSETVIEQKAYKWTAQQSSELEKKARNLGIDPEKFKKDAWANQKRTKVLS